MRRLSALAKAILTRAAMRFARDEGGQVLLIFALAATSVVMFVGVAMDYTRASRARTNLQNSLDAVVLSIAREAQESTSDEALKEMASARMATMLKNYEFEVTSVATTSGTLTINAEGSIQAGLTSVAGYETLEQRVTSQAAWGTGKLEVALVSIAPVRWASSAGWSS
jgi:Flp pilus assembly protein TadG